MKTRHVQLREHQHQLARCRRCPGMQGPPVIGTAVLSPIMLIGQAPGDKEIHLHRPFAWTAGKTLFQWFAGIGLDEDAFRRRVYMAAICRCFPGKKTRGGDRVPAPEEIANCSTWLETELTLLRPQLIIPVGRLAISRFMPFRKLTEVVGTTHQHSVQGRPTDVLPLPHPSGASTWHRTDPGRDLLAQALQRLARHPAWRRVCAQQDDDTATES